MKIIRFYFFFRKIRNRLLLYNAINWSKTLYFNFKMLPFGTAVKLPVLIYGRVSLRKLTGKINIQAEIKTGMIGLGQPYEIFRQSMGVSELCLEGEITFKGHVQIERDFSIYVHENAHLELGHMSSLGSRGKIICYQSIILGNFCRIGFESQLIDTNFHKMIDLNRSDVSSDEDHRIVLGNYNYLGSRVSIMKNTKTADYCTIASNSVVNKDYRPLGNNVLIGGVPAKYLRSNVTRDWDGEMDNLVQWLTVKLI